MALWRFDITALEVTGQDNNGWPLTRLVDLTMEVRESKVLKLYHTGNQLAKEQFPGYTALRVNSFERADKRTDKTYGCPGNMEDWHHGLDGLRCGLTPQQQAALKRLQEVIMAKLIGESQLHDNLLVFFGSDAWVSSLGNDLACLHTQSGILSHTAANGLIAALENFYSRITPDELVVLKMNNANLTQSDLTIVRSFNVEVEK